MAPHFIQTIFAWKASTFMITTTTSTKLSVLLVSCLAAVVSLTACSQTAQVNTTPSDGNAAKPVSKTTEPEKVGLAPSAPGIQIDGSSTVYPITALVAKEFRQTPRGENANIEVKFSGTSSGFKKFCAGEIDISGASRPILLEEVAACDKAGVRFIELPVAFDALTIAVNPKNDWANDLTVAELKKMWEPAAQGKIKTWKQVRSSFPDRPLALFGAGDRSGTFDYFNEVTSGKAKASRSDYKGSEDDNDTVKGVATDPNAIGYFGFSYYEANQQRLKPVAINSGKGAILPSRATVENGTYQPFSRPLLIYVNYKSAQDKQDVHDFVDFYLKNAKNLVASVGSIPLPEDGYRLARVQFDKGKVGTVFEGLPQPNVTIDALLRKQAVFQLSANETEKK
ncbi:MAG: PstS family phosphate ABC transporter substrate-binding protein [Stenomitos frigidus ULC029]